jgi:hypothetical protein
MSDNYECCKPGRICYACDGLADETARRSVLMEAEEVVNGPRRKEYGHPRDNFNRIVSLWNAYLQGRPDPQAPISAEDHALCMILLKIARLQETPGHRDSLVDIAGYAATYEYLMEKP